MIGATRRDVVLVVGPWRAGVSGVAAALRERLPGPAVVESPALAPGAAPTAVVFVVSAVAPVTLSDCVLLDTAAAATDLVIGAVSKIDVHRNWRDVLAADRDALGAHTPRYRGMPWVGVAAAPRLGPAQVDDVITALCERLADPDLDRRNRMRATDARLAVLARVAALRQQRDILLRQRRVASGENALALRSHIQRARVQLSYLASKRCVALRAELQRETARLARRSLPGFSTYARGRMDETLAELAERASAHVTDVMRALDVPGQRSLPAVDPPAVDFPAAPLRSRRLETRLMMLLGVGFGLGVALTLSRLLTGLAPGLAAGGMGAGIAMGLALTFWVVRIRGLLHDRALLDRWVGEAVEALRATMHHLVATRVLTAESVLSAALNRWNEADRARVTDLIATIDRELRAHAGAGRPSKAGGTSDSKSPKNTGF